MGSRIGGVGGAGYAGAQGVNNWQQRQQNFSALNTALQSGNLDTAQKAYTSLVGNSANIDPSSPLGQIGAALKSGNLSAAQQTAQTLHANRAQHHHGGGAAPAQSTGSGANPGGVIN